MQFSCKYEYLEPFGVAQLGECIEHLAARQHVGRVGLLLGARGGRGGGSLVIGAQRRTCEHHQAARVRFHRTPHQYRRLLQQQVNAVLSGRRGLRSSRSCSRRVGLRRRRVRSVQIVDFRRTRSTGLRHFGVFRRGNRRLRVFGSKRLHIRECVQIYCLSRRQTLHVTVLHDAAPSLCSRVA